MRRYLGLQCLNHEAQTVLVPFFVNARSKYANIKNMEQIRNVQEGKVVEIKLRTIRGATLLVIESAANILNNGMSPI